MSRPVDAEVLLKSIDENCWGCGKLGTFTCKNEIGICLYQDIRERIDDLPTIDPVKHGHWEMKSDPFGFFDEIPVCSECGCTTEMRKTYKFCPYCGAKMTEEVADETD